MTDKTSDNGGGSDIVSLAEAAARLGKSERTIRRYIDAGKLAVVEIGGKVCVQLAGSDDRRHVSEDSVPVTANAVANAGSLSEELVDTLQDTIRRQDAEISRLWDTLNRVTAAMLPARTETSGAQPRSLLWLWILLALIAGIGAGVGIGYQMGYSVF